LNNADVAAVKTCPVCCMRALMSCRFSSTLSRLLIFLIGDGDVALDVVGNVARDDAWDDVGVVAFDDVDSCSLVYISALMVSINLCCFSLCCMSDCAILSLFFLHSSAIWCLLHWYVCLSRFCCPRSQVRCIFLGLLASLVVFVVAVVRPGPVPVVRPLCCCPFPGCRVGCLFRLAVLSHLCLFFNILTLSLVNFSESYFIDTSKH
jgi:hypothetical protein